MNNFKNTRAVVLYLSKYISGKTIDYGAGNAKYRKLITPFTSEYVAFDMIPGENIDVVGDALNPPFADNYFDTVISTQVLEHVEKPWKVVSEMRRILKPGGTCIVTAPFLVPYHADPSDFFRFTKEGMESLFRNEDFKIEESGTYGKVPSVLIEMFHFSLLSHYDYKEASSIKTRVRGKLMRTIKALASRLDSLFRGKTIYANSYVVARNIKDY